MRETEEKPAGVSRREFLKISGIAASVPLVGPSAIIEVAGQELPVHGPGAVPVTLNVNGKRFTENLEPRVTLLDALRHHSGNAGIERAVEVIQNGLAAEVSC